MRFTCEAAGRAVSCCRHWSVQRAACCAVSQGTGLKTANTCVQGVDTASRKKHIHFVSVRALCSRLSHFSEKESYRILGESTQCALGVWVKGSILQFFIVCISFAFRLHVFSFSLALLCHNLGRSNLSFIKMYMLAIWSKPKSETDLPVGYFIFVFSMRYDAKLYRSKPLNTCSHNPKAFLYFISFFSSMNSSARSWLLWFLLWIWMSAMSTRDAQRMMHTYNPLLLFLISL